MHLSNFMLCLWLASVTLDTVYAQGGLALHNPFSTTLADGRKVLNVSLRYVESLKQLLAIYILFRSIPDPGDMSYIFSKTSEGIVPLLASYSLFSDVSHC